MRLIQRAAQLGFCLVWAAILVRGENQHPVGKQTEPAAEQRTRQHPELPVLGYVTPWHSRGKQLVEDHRGSFDIVSPVWYTVHLNGNDAAERYTVRGGPPDKDDESWYQRLQKPSPSGSKALQIMPRFLLDGWTQEDYRQLAFNGTLWSQIATVIMQTVEDMSFDGIVFESTASHVLYGPLSELSKRLWVQEKTMILVLRPTREHDESHEDISEQTVKLLTHVVDYFSVMTYDMTGPGGIEWEEPFPADSPLHTPQTQHNVRLPGPNTSAAWIRHNIVALRSNQDYDIASNFPVLYSGDGSAKVGLGRFLIGLPLYGYKYPVMFANAESGKIIQERGEDEDELCIMRGSGEAVVMSQIEDLIEKHQPKLQKEHGKNPEYYFDYVENGSPWRLYLPTVESMSKILNVISQSSEDQDSGCGVALWEVGQSSTELLLTL